MKSIHIVEEDLPSAWERAVCVCWESGERVATEYDQPGAPASRDVVAFIHVTDPFKEPRIHRAFPGGLEDLEKYRLKCCTGCMITGSTRRQASGSTRITTDCSRTRFQERGFLIKSPWS